MELAGGHNTGRGYQIADRHQNLIGWSLGHSPPFQKCDQNQFITFGHILFTRNDYAQRQRDTHPFAVVHNQPPPGGSTAK